VAGARTIRRLMANPFPWRHRGAFM
jgi:hypothetical protein